MANETLLQHHHVLVVSLHLHDVQHQTVKKLHTMAHSLYTNILKYKQYLETEPILVFVNGENVSTEHGMIDEDLLQALPTNILLVMSSLHLSEEVLDEKVSHKNRKSKIPKTSVISMMEVFRMCKSGKCSRKSIRV